jgi:hypothetical protein
MSNSAGISAFLEQALLTATSKRIESTNEKGVRAIHPDKYDSIAKTTLKVQIFSIILLFVMFLYR